MRFLIPLACSAVCVFAHEDDSELTFDRFFGGDSGWAFHLHSDVESRYASEGRDSLDGDSLATGTLEASWNAFSLGMWYGKSPEQSYDELRLSSAVSWVWKDLESYFAYTHLRFPEDGSHDHEISAGVSWSGLPWELALAMDAYYSFAADGTFIETSLHRDFDVSDRLKLLPALVFGMNQDYITEGHDGANHIELRCGGEYALTQSLTLTAHTSYNFGVDRDVVNHAGDELLGDFFHAALGLRWEF